MDRDRKRGEEMGVPRADSDVRGYPCDPVHMDESMCLADEAHYIVPGAFYQAVS